MVVDTINIQKLGQNQGPQIRYLSAISDHLNSILSLCYNKPSSLRFGNATMGQKQDVNPTFA